MDVMGYCRDKVVPFPKACEADVVAFGKKSKLLGDENYMQLMMQATENPSDASYTHVMELLRALEKSSPPSKEMGLFLRHFHGQQNAGDSDDECFQGNPAPSRPLSRQNSRNPTTFSVSDMQEGKTTECRRRSLMLPTSCSQVLPSASFVRAGSNRGSGASGISAFSGAGAGRKPSRHCSHQDAIPEKQEPKKRRGCCG